MATKPRTRKAPAAKNAAVDPIFALIEAVEYVVADDEAGEIVPVLVNAAQAIAAVLAGECA